MITEFTGKIFDVDVGHVFVIGGKTIDCAARLDVNLQTGKHDSSTIPFHISVRFETNHIVRNTYVDQGWGEEEQDGNLLENVEPNNPIVPGENFKFYILVMEDGFYVAINDMPFCTYKHRIPYAEIQAITVRKDAQYITQIDHRQIFPFAHPMIQCDNDRSVAFSNDVPRKFQPGHIIVLTGIPFGSPKGAFMIRFCEHDTKKEALHFNARFSSKTVVRNAMDDNLRFHDQEERDGGFPFIIDQQFKMAIGMAEDCFRFSINGNYFATFKYRMPHQLDGLNGFKITVNNGLQIEITEIDHLHTGQVISNETIIKYSSPSYALMY